MKVVHQFRDWLRLLWPRFCRYIVTSAHHPGLLDAVTLQAPESPWSLVGSLDGHTVKLYPVGGARARVAFEALIAPKPAGWLEFRHGATVRSRYASPSA